MPKLKPRPTIIPQIETDELSAIFRRKWGKRARVQAAEQGSEDLPATDDAAKESLITLKVNLLNPVVRLVRGVADLEQIRSKLRAAYSNLADLIDRITPKQWAGLVEKGMRFARQDIDAFIRRVKGGLLELNFHYSQSLNTLRRLCESKVSQVAVPASRNWQRNVVLIEESYSIYKAGRKQFADVLFVVF